MIDIDEQLESSTPMHPSRAARLPSSHDGRPLGATSRSRRRTVAITGAAGGLGEGLAVALRAKKANPAFIDLDAQATADRAERLGGKRVAVGLEANVLDLASLEAAIASAEQHFGRVDVVIAAAASRSAHHVRWRSSTQTTGTGRSPSTSTGRGARGAPACPTCVANRGPSW